MQYNITQLNLTESYSPMSLQQTFEKTRETQPFNRVTTYTFAEFI
jgi:hypothetical protein